MTPYPPEWRGLREVFPVKLTAVTNSSGTYLYSGKEQVIDPTTGALEDADPALEFNTTGCLLREVNNNNVSVSGSPKVWARFRGVKDGVPVFEFAREDPTTPARIVYRGKLDGTLTAGGSATMSVWEYTGGSETDTGVNVTVYDWLLASGNIAANTKVIALYDAASDRIYVTAASCA